MNEKINKLWDQAWDDNTPLSIIKEKFAEMIVRECLRMCDVAEINYALYDKLKEADGAIGAKEQIENYFGVEE